MYLSEASRILCDRKLLRELYYKEILSSANSAYWGAVECIEALLDAENLWVT